MTSEEYELDNIEPKHIVPKSSARALVAGFDAYCRSASSVPATAARLRGADYVEVPGAFLRKGVRSFVVDDKRPMVLLSRRAGHQSCAVAAEARTGQTAAAETYVSRTFPGYQPVAGDDAMYERAWMSPDRSTLIYTLRDAEARLPARYAIGKITTKTPTNDQ